MFVQHVIEIRELVHIVPGLESEPPHDVPTRGIGSIQHADTKAAGLADHVVGQRFVAHAHHDSRRSIGNLHQCIEALTVDPVPCLRGQDVQAVGDLKQGDIDWAGLGHNFERHKVPF